jgi:hypothetical protein
MNLSNSVIFENEKQFLNFLPKLQKFCIKYIDHIILNSISKNPTFTTIEVEFDFSTIFSDIDELNDDNIEKDFLKLFKLSDDLCLLDFEY